MKAKESNIFKKIIKLIQDCLIVTKEGLIKF